jgi:hypothetical protein
VTRVGGRLAAGEAVGRVLCGGFLVPTLLGACCVMAEGEDQGRIVIFDCYSLDHVCCLERGMQAGTWRGRSTLPLVRSLARPFIVQRE